jgi:hypothetical protein
MLWAVGRFSHAGHRISVSACHMGDVHCQSCPHQGLLHCMPAGLPLHGSFMAAPVQRNAWARPSNSTPHAKASSSRHAVAAAYTTTQPLSAACSHCTAEPGGSAVQPACADHARGSCSCAGQARPSSSSNTGLRAGSAHWHSNPASMPPALSSSSRRRQRQQRHKARHPA